MMPLLVAMLCFYPFQTKELTTIADLRWKHRIVLFFPEDGASLDDTGEDAQMEELKLLWFEVGKMERTNYKGARNPDFFKGLSEKYKGAAGSWLLIGLDGGVKLQGNGVPDWKLIYAMINAMPMRQAETRNGGLSSNQDRKELPLIQLEWENKGIIGKKIP